MNVLSVKVSKTKGEVRPQTELKGRESEAAGQARGMRGEFEGPNEKLEGMPQAGPRGEGTRSQAELKLVVYTF